MTGSVRRRGHFDNEPGDDYATEFISRDMLIDFLDSGWAEVHSLVLDADPDRIVSTGSISLTGATDTYPLPSDLFRLRQVDWRSSSSDEWTRCEPFSAGERDAWRDTEDPPLYRLQGENIELSSETQAGELRLRYNPAAVRISSSLQSVDGIEGLEELVVLKALRRCKVRADEPTAEVDAEIGLFMSRIKGVARDRDRGSPKRLNDPRIRRWRGTRWR